MKGKGGKGKGGQAMEWDREGEKNRYVYTGTTVESDNPPAIRDRGREQGGSRARTPHTEDKERVKKVPTKTEGGQTMEVLLF